MKEFYEPTQIFPAELEDREYTAEDFWALAASKKDVVVVLTANPVEARMMVRLLHHESCECGQKLPALYENGFWYRLGKIGDTNVLHLQAWSISSFIDGGSHPAVCELLENFTPALIVSLGVAYGADPDTQRLGDVLVSEALCSYAVNNKYIDDTISYKRDVFFETDSQVMGAWRPQLLCSVPDACAAYDGFTYPFRWECGTMLSAGSVLSSAAEKHKLSKAMVDLNEKYIGGEMEGAGVYYACDKRRIPCVVVKGICDWGEMKNSWKALLGEQDVQNCRVWLNESNIPADREELNELVKDCVQGLAFRNAFITLKYLLGFSRSMLANSGSGNAIGGKMVLVPGKIKSGLQKVARGLPAVSAVLLAASVISMIVMLAQLRGESFQNVWFFILCVLAVGSAAYLGWFGWKKRAMPVNLIINQANLKIESVDFGNCVCQFRNMEDLSIRDVRTAWIRKAWNMPIRISDHGELAGQEAAVTCYEEKLGNTLNRTYVPAPVKVDTLQIEYGWKNRRYCHVIRPCRSNRSDRYREQVFVYQNNACHKILSRVCRINNSV